MSKAGHIRLQSLHISLEIIKLLQKLEKLTESIKDKCDADDIEEIMKSLTKVINDGKGVNDDLYALWVSLGKFRSDKVEGDLKEALP